MRTPPAESLIFNIQHCSMHDGPGIRTVIFFKGCPLRCPWCSNPESQSPDPELAFKPALCLGQEICGRCQAACPHGGVAHGPDGGKVFNREACLLCGQCVEACPSRALTMFGQSYAFADLLRIAERDRDFYATSGGGITLSGGEPLWRAELPAALLRSAKERGLHTCLETCGFFDRRSPFVCDALEHLDWLIFDVKHVDSGVHRHSVGVDTDRILKNLRHIRKRYPALPLVVRTPVIGGFNATPATIGAIAALLADIGDIRRYELLPYHAFGAVKYQQLGRPYTMGEEARLTGERMAELCAAAAKHVECVAY